MISTENKVNESVINYGLVNNILAFNKLSQLDVVKADLEFLGNKMTLRPAPDKTIYYNLKEWISALFSSKGFSDVLNIDIDQYGIVYDVTNLALIKGGIKITFFMLDGSTETVTNSVYFTNGLKQIEDYNRRDFQFVTRDSVIPLAPLLPVTNRVMYLDYWVGYPLDITIHKSGSDLDTVFKNNDNGTSLIVKTKPNELISRYVFSDGRDDLNLLETMKLINGENNITVSSNGKSFELRLNRVPLCKFGIYIKWINSDGGYSYYFFNKGERSRKTSELGSIENDYLNLDETTSPTLSIGKDSSDQIKVSALCVEPERQNYLNDMIDSPSIYMFTGVPFNRNTFNDWLDIRLKTADVRIENAKHRLNNYDFIFELPKRNTRKR